MALVLPIEELLEPVSAKQPCGQLDAANEAHVDALFEAVKFEASGFHVLRETAEGLFRGGRVPDLIKARNGSEKVDLKPVKHLKAAMVLALAGLETEGIAGFSDGLALIARLLSTMWEHVYPLVDAEDPEDPYVRRVNALNPLCMPDPYGAGAVSGPVIAVDPWRIAERFLEAPLLTSDRHGAVSVRDCLSPWAVRLKILLPAGEERSADYVHEVRLAATEMLPNQRQALQFAVDSAKTIDRVLKEAPGTIKPKFDYLIRLLEAALCVLDDTLGPAGVDASLGVGVAVTSTSQGSIGNKGIQSAGSTTSREEAVRKLTEVAEYFRRHEPSSPLPLLIDRMKRLAGMNFMMLLEELQLGEQAVPEFRKLAGVREQPVEEMSSTSSENPQQPP